MTPDLPTAADVGIYIDGSHMRNVDGDVAVIELARLYGMEIDAKTLEIAVNVWDEKDDTDESAELIRETSIECEEWLNNQLPPGLYFHWEESCFFLSSAEDDDND